MLARYTELQAVSSVWQTRPVGMRNQPDFLNAAAIIKTPLSARQLKRHVLRKIETALGRVRQANKNGPRPIDIDIMLFNNQIFELEHRHIPDAELVSRPFVAIPLAQIAPDYVHPETGQTLQEIANTFAIDPEEMRLRAELLLLPAHLPVQPQSHLLDLTTNSVMEG